MDSFSQYLASHFPGTFPETCIIYASPCSSRYQGQRRPNSLPDLYSGNRAVGSLVVRASDRKAWVRCPMPPNTLRVHTEYVLVKSVGPKSCGLSHERKGLENLSPPYSSMQNLWMWR
ncbi:hypothetical protein TNCV_3444071 [Trichonephila clavipes]|nr:hypothetical protein TNCV_3444071 [Trichonephila clavipes]